MNHRHRQKCCESKDISSRISMKHSHLPSNSNDSQCQHQMWKHQIYPKVQLRQSHNNSIIRKQQGQNNTSSNSTIILLLLTPYPQLTIFITPVADVPSNANNSSQYSSNPINRSSKSTILSSQTASLVSRSWSFNSNVAKRSQGA